MTSEKFVYFSSNNVLSRNHRPTFLYDVMLTALSKRKKTKQSHETTNDSRDKSKMTTTKVTKVPDSECSFHLQLLSKQISTINFAASTLDLLCF